MPAELVAAFDVAEAGLSVAGAGVRLGDDSGRRLALERAARLVEEAAGMLGHMAGELRALAVGTRPGSAAGAAYPWPAVRPPLALLPPPPASLPVLEVQAAAPAVVGAPPARPGPRRRPAVGALLRCREPGCGNLVWPRDLVKHLEEVHGLKVPEGGAREHFAAPGRQAG
jgi:hypothetical protein